MGKNNHSGEWEGLRGLKVNVRDNNIDQAIRRLKKMVIQEGLIRELKEREFFTRPGEKRRLKNQEARRRTQRNTRKQNEEWDI